MPESEAPAKISKVQYDEVTRLLAVKDRHVDMTLSYFHIKDLADLSVKDYERLCGALNMLPDKPNPAHQRETNVNDKQGCPVLAIQLNNCTTNDTCAICGERTDPECGPELFVAGTTALVCYECGRKYEPELVDAL